MLHIKSGPVKRRLLLYQDSGGRRPFADWLMGLRDPSDQDRIPSRLNRVAAGLFGDVKPVGEGVMELRLMFGPGYRIYFGCEGDQVVLLLCAGDKSSQRRDIRKAKEFWADYRRRK